MASIDTMLGLIGKLESPYITVHQERCALVRNRHADCLRCAESCASGCISYDGEALTVSPEKCIGCDTCATVCPTCALEAHHPSDAALTAAARASRAANEDVAYLGCGELLERARGRYDEEKIARVECLGRVDEALLADLAVEGAREVVLIHGDCERCEHKRGRACAEAVVETAEKLLEIWGSPMTVRFSGKLPASAKKMADHDSGRRAVLAESAALAARAGAVVAETAVAEALLSSREVLRLPADSAGFKLPSAEADWQILLLDDLQDMQEEQDWNALCELIRACPERRFVLLSRGTPPGSLMAFQYTGLMTVLEADDLLFDADDVRRLLRLYGVEAAGSEIDGILKESVGYPLGVAITARCMSPGKPWTPELVARVFREVFLYFETAIYRRFDLPVRRFLLELAPFESFDLEMARMVSGDPRAGEEVLIAGHLPLSGRYHGDLLRLGIHGGALQHIAAHIDQKAQHKQNDWKNQSHFDDLRRAALTIPLFPQNAFHFSTPSASSGRYPYTAFLRCTDRYTST